MSLKWWGFLATIIAITGLAGLYYVLNQLYPSPITRTLFFVLLFITASTFIVPLLAYLNHRFGGKNWRVKDVYRLLRQGGEFGLMVVILAYLQLIRALDWMIALVLLGVIVLMETFFLTRE